MSKQILRLFYLETLMLLLIISTSAIAGESVITGKAVDNFGTSVEGVKIEIENTSLESQTDKKGEYKIEFVPGQFRVIYSKDGYKQEVLELNISKEARFPAKKIVLFKNPDSQGVFLIGKTNYEKIEQCKLNKNGSTKVEYSVSGTPTYIAPRDTFSFLLYPPNENLTFLGYSIGLYKLEQGIIGHMFILEPSFKAINFEKWQKVDGVGDIGEIRLKEGEYAFSWTTLNGSIFEPTYCFYVSSKKELPSWALSEWKTMEELAKLAKSMVLVKGGCYQMGNTFEDLNPSEKPVHEICVDDFYIGKYEVTQKEWNAVMGNNPSKFKGCDDCPVEQVSWNDAQEFINKLNQKTGNKYRLPTEAEWEYAARSGGKNEIYAGGNDIDSVAWYNDNSGSKTHPVGQKQPNGLGIYDMSGNVWEWVQDWYDVNYYKNSPKDNPKGSSNEKGKVFRGGSWADDPMNARAVRRVWGVPADRFNFIGFRLASSAQ